jgi:hypothetical protein
MAMSPGFYRKTKQLNCYRLAPKGKGISMGAPGMTTGMEGGNRLYAGSFWHQVRKKPELSHLKS